MSCPICGVSDSGRHHYDCPNDRDFKKERLVEMQATEEVKEKYVLNGYVAWRRRDGMGYIVVKAQ